MKKFTKYNTEKINFALLPRGIILLDEYNGPNVKVNFKCSEGHVWSALTSNVLHKTGCPQCKGGSKLTPRQIGIIRDDLKNRGITFNEYISFSSKTDFTCMYGHKWSTTLNSVHNGKTGCPYCANRPPLTKEIMNERLIGRGITLIGKYISCHFKTEFKCDFGHNWLATPDNIIRKGQGCPTCALDFAKPTQIYVLEISGNDDLFTGFGISNRAKTRIDTHTLEIKKHNRKILNKKIFYTNDRFAALSIENKLKTTLPIYNSGIPGFITEATMIDFNKVINIIDEFLIEGKNVR